MKENIILMVLPAAAVVIILLLKDRISDALWRRRNPPEKLADEIRARLLQTDWDFYKRYLQRPVPAALRELYSNTELLITACASYRGKRTEINSFEPLNEDNLIDTHDEIGHDIVPFATSVCGDPIYLKPGSKEADTVYITYHDDPRHVEVFAESVAVILQKAQEVKRAT